MNQRRPDSSYRIKIQTSLDIARPDLGEPAILSRALDLHQKQNFSEAEVLYRQLITQFPTSPRGFYFYGLLALHFQNFAVAEELIAQALRLDHVTTEPWIALARIRMGQARLHEAKAALAQVLARDSCQTDAYALSAIISREMGNMAHALEGLAATLVLAPAHAEALSNLSVFAHEAQFSQTRLAASLRAIRVNPQFPEALGNAAMAHLAIGAYEPAIDYSLRALAAAPRFQPAFRHLALAYQNLGQKVQASSAYATALCLLPTDVDAWSNLASFQLMSKCADAARANYEKAIRLAPSSAALWAGRSLAHFELGMSGQTGFDIAAALALEPAHDSYRLQVLTALPVIARSRAHIETWRRHLEGGLQKLLERPLVLENLVTDVAHPNFYLAYHGQDNAQIQRLFGRVLDKSAPTPPLMAHSACKTKGPKKHIAIISAHLSDHTIGRLFKETICAADRNKYTLALFRPHIHTDEIARAIDQHLDQTIDLRPDLSGALTQIAGFEPDLIFYPDLGMDIFTTMLASRRMAPVQVTTWGHPDTTGFSSMDYFISTTLADDLPTDGLYSEGLIKLEEFPPQMARIEAPPARFDRADFGLSADRHLYGCPQSLFKFHPDFDDALANILRADPNGEIALLAGPYPMWQNQLADRFSQSYPDIDWAGRVRFVPRLDRDRFLGLLAQCDVLLDPFHFSGGLSSIEGLAMGTPIVTLPGAYLRGRLTLACYRKLEIDEMIAVDARDYVQIALRLTHDADFNDKVRQKISYKINVLFDNVKHSEAFWAFIDSVI